MNKPRAAVAFAMFLLTAISAFAACPTTPPTYYLQVTYAGTNCSSGFYGSTCALAQPIEFNAASIGFGDPLQACDVITWNFGDGASDTKAAGVTSATHTYASAGSYPITLTVTNSLGTRTSFYSTPTVAVANGYFQFPDSCCSSPSVKEGLPASFTVQRTSGTGSASVQYATSDGSAYAGTNYVATSGTLTFAPGEVQKTVTVPTIDDGGFHSDIYFRMTLSSPTGGFLVGNSGTTMYINDVDPRPVLGFESTAYTVSEGVGSIAIRVLRSVVTSTTVSVAYQIQNSGSMRATVPSNGVLTFFAGETVKTITVPILASSTYDGDRSVVLGLSNPTNFATFGQNPYTGSATITVKDDQTEPVAVFNDISVLEGNSGTKVINASVTLSNPAGFEMIVYPFLTDGTARFSRDYTYSTSSFYIPAGQTVATFPVQIVGNTAAEPNKRFAINGNVTRADCCTFTQFRTQPGTGTILNDDATVSPARVSIAAHDTGFIIANFGAAPASAQTVTLSSSDPAIATVPDTVSIVAASTAIGVTAIAGGHATITATVPAAYGGGTFATDVYVYEGAALVLSPASVSVPVGGTATITASMKPALSTTEGAALKSTGTGKITIPDRVFIDAGQTSTFTITGVQSGLVEITAALGPNRGNALAFINVEVTPAPTTSTITQISPPSGPAAGGTAVTINGANLRPECTIRFGGIPATNAAFVSASSMTATTPEHAAGAVDVSLACGIDSFNFSKGYTYLAASATLSGVTPSFGSTTGNTLVTITGSNIASGCWPFFDGIPARSATVNGPAEMIASTPGHAAAATVPVLIRCTGAVDVALANAFTYSSAAESSPVITGVDPLVGSSGKSVTISGARFRVDDAVTFDSAGATVLSTSPGTHVVRIPEIPLGKTSITVTDLGGHASTTGPIFTIVEPQPPQLTSVTPPTSRPSNEVAIDGSGFRPGYTFTIGDQPAPIVTMTYTRLVLRVPQLAPGSYAVNALNAASKIAAVGPQLKVLAGGLAAIRVAPICATTEGGTLMTIIGTGFASGAVVTFDGAIASGVAVVDAQTITLPLPPLPAGTPRIVVTNANGDSASLTKAFNVTSPFDPNGCAPRPRPARH
ncbi:MAG TPA: IPT/TIG domain-containing protein [Thermoanaerobaculia bacterium]|jgi:PKD repeat protein|nr:IPT/TIG domain-containing protein [Thermoanaerobaculia bacterium]